MITIKDVANRANVSVCTASRVLSNKGYLKESTKKKVMDAVNELGYVRNHTAVELKTGTSDTIAIVLPDIENLFYSHFANILEKYAYSKGYLVFICNTAYDLKKEEVFLRGMSARNIRGLIAVPVTSDISNYKKYLGNVPFVVFNRNLTDDEVVCYKIDNKLAAIEITSHLVQIGRKNIAGIFRSFNNDIYRERYDGVKETILDFGLNFCEDNMILDAEDSIVEEKIRKLFSKKNHPDAIFAGNDMLAYMVYKVLNEIGLRIPDDVAVASIDNTIMTERVYPTLTSYNLPIEEFAKLIIDGFSGNGFDQKTKVMKGQVIKRMSTKV